MRRNLFIQYFFVPSIFVIIGCGSVIREYFVELQGDHPFTWLQAVLDQLPYWLAWAFLSILIQKLARHYRLERPHLRRGLLVHISASVFCAALITTLNLLLNPINYPASQSDPTYSVFLFVLLPVIVIYWATLGIYLAFYYQQELQAEALQTSRLNARLVEARLKALQMQLQPHFLFNTLHSITALVLKEENRTAVKMINRLSDFLRLTLASADTQIVSLKTELEFTERYLEIERIRFEDRLTIRMDVDPRTLDARVPNMILQPLVENAVRHGISHQTGACQIEIKTQVNNGKVYLEVRDSGKGSTEDAGAKKDNGGVGLKNTRERLFQLYGEEYSFNLLADENTGVAAQIVLPFIQ